MTRILFIRSAWHQLMTTAVAGRSEASGLLPQGQLQAIALAAKLERLGVTKLQASPRRRARETAEPAAANLRLALDVVPELDDMDFGAWTGMPLCELDRDPAWCAWNADRENHAPPGGESMKDVQRRMLDHLADTFRLCGNETIAMFSHAVPIRAALLKERGLPLNAFAQVAVEPGGIVALGAVSIAPVYSAVA